jgi:hypothetical protein
MRLFQIPQVDKLLEDQFILTFVADDDASVTVEGDSTLNVPNLERQCMAARSWIHGCRQEHKLCRQSREKFLPPRVLDLRPEGIEGMRLHVCAEGEQGEYAALSYCWGGPQRVMTTSKNLHEHIEGINEDTLPQTILDTVRVIRALDIHYLRIDALCILQDSDEDKQVQLALMGDIYHNSLVILVATKAKSVEDRFLKRFPAMSYSREPPRSNYAVGELMMYFNNTFLPDHDPVFQRA